MTSGRAQRLPKPVSAECEPMGRFTVTLETGTSGVLANVVVVMPFLMSVLPTTITRTPLPSSTRSRSGKDALACDTRIAGPFIFACSTGVLARTPPTNEPDGHLNGSASNVAAGHALLSVVRREGSCSGNCTFTDFMFACPAAWLIVVSRLTPLALVNFAIVAALKDGLKPSLSHWLTWNGLDRLWVPVMPPAASVKPLSTDSVASGLQLVGLSKKPCLLVLTLMRRMRTSTPLTRRGTVLVTITRAVLGSTLIVARVTTRPRLNGPATAGTAIERPYGAPL